ncbi:hypothetical protein M0R45_008706 [Rubus argutus]|uniref:Aminotransferase-like plant mobile domain-containing protein n=1 Tax=Rubus argutus TaxID=59490 RepID=A0AAW1Y234_RUBAR
MENYLENEVEAIEFSEKYSKVLSSVADKVHAGVVHKLAAEDLPTCYLGPHFPGGMPQKITNVLDKYPTENSSHFIRHSWSSWSCTRPQGWPTLTEEWKAWVPRMEFFFADHWQRIGIYEAIKLTELDIVVEKPILAAALSFWSSATNTMNLPLGYMSPTILDICTLIGLSHVGVEISANHDLPTTFGDGMLPPKFQDKDEQKEAINQLKRSRNYNTLYKKYAMTDSNPSDREPPKENEHAAFLLYWLSKYIFCCRSGQCNREYAPLAESLASGTRLALGPFVLAHLYRSLHDIVTNQMDLDVGGPLWLFQLWLRAYFPQMSNIGPEYSQDVGYGRHLLILPSSHLSVEKCFTMLYTLRNLKNFSVCYSQWRPASLIFGMTERCGANVTKDELKAAWGSFLIPRDLPYGMIVGRKRKPWVEVYLPNYFARQFGFIQSCPVPYHKLENHLCSWRVMFKSKRECSLISERFHKQLSRFKIEDFQPSSRPTLLLASWWSNYSKKFVSAENEDVFTLRIKDTIAEVLKHDRTEKRTRPFTSSNDKPPALKKQTTSHAQKTTSANSGDSSHTVELAISDEEGAADTWVGDGDLISENTATSFPKSDEAYMDGKPEHESPVSPQTTPIPQQEIPDQETSYAHMLTTDALALLDALDGQTKPKPKRADCEETKAAAKFIETLCRSPLLGVVTDGLYGRLKKL